MLDGKDNGMTGVEILAMEEVVTAYAFNLKGYLLFILAASVFCTIIGIIAGIPNDITFGVGVGLAFGLGVGALLGLIPAWTTLPKEYEAQYKVIISDEVSMNDFLSKYEIIDQEGKIYTVRERND
jgi:hypothetical protein